ncbi:NAD(P)/FAD-dependent oxidoreductase [Pseudonocardia sp. DSM 110487]|uniref:NAD(P)/FAD-dependent oxidoreductase n=1 Tax=Pseudonocardia sp. DSM 110487 TaxID=2865833 RepID=UPI001C69E33B|nr:NAD(P)/FAD-dependent oxidoreductase [Pseudonocardia sp. DSM 110487]QYN31813.1 NAD(P)/FAD-dependent oxidoreductase [Pseudonocardia sp. DSM 110487]
MNGYDVIVVGARCAGSPTAMLLARAGHDVLVVDRASFPSDTLSTHIVHAPGVAALRRWGLLDRAVAGCPPIDTYVFDFGPFTITGSPGTAFAPRRTVLDTVLVEAARAAGAEVRERFTVSEVLVEDGRVTGIRGHDAGGGGVTERARVVVGADGLRSLVARAVRPEQYREKPRLLCGYYAYWSGLPMDGRFETYDRPARGFAAWPTNDDLTLVIAGWPFREFAANRTDLEGNYLATIGTVPAFAERLRDARRETRIVGTAVPNYFRKPYGPGWALIGDAGYNTDFITGQGIQDAFRDAERCAAALHEALTGDRPFDDALHDYQAARDAHVGAMYEFTAEVASLEPPPPELQRLLAAASTDQEAMNGFVRVAAGLTSPAEFFSDENVGRILGVTS